MSKFGLFLWFLASVQVLWAQDSPLDVVAQGGVGRHGLLSYCFVDAATGEELASQHADFLTPPASTLKLLTTLSAIGELGPDHCFETKVFLDGVTESGMFKGDLIIQGTGDPSLGSRYLRADKRTEFIDRLIETLVAKGISSIEGRIVLDDSFFGQNPQVPKRLYEDIGNYYGAGIWSLSFHDNAINYFFDSPRAEGEKTRILGQEPELCRDIKVINKVVSGPKGSGDKAYFFGDPSSTELLVEGSIPPGKARFKVKAAMPRVPYYFGAYVSSELEKAGISLSSERVWKREPYDVKGDEIMVYKSPSLREIAKLTNYHSINLYAEAMLRYMGRVDGSQMSGSLTERGLRRVMRRKEAADHIDLSHWTLYDGSGLSTLNGVDARGFAAVLAAYWRDSDDIIPQIVPQMGLSGSLRGLVEVSSPLYGEAYVKSGTISQTKAYAGFLRTRSGNWVSFYVNAHRHSGSRKARTALIKLLETAAMSL